MPYLDDRGVCPRCAMPDAGIPCRGCRGLSPHLKSVRAACAYEGIARAAVHALKFRAGRYLAPTLADLVEECAIALRPLQADLLVPVPLAPRRMRDRGYNQAELLARHLAPSIGAEMSPTVLARIDRPAQQTLSRAARVRNLRGAITCVDSEQVSGGSVWLVDDVMTTGSTLSACADALAAAGARHVGALVFARDL